MNISELINEYQTGQTIGAYVDSPDLSSEIRNYARGQRQEYFANASESPLFRDKAPHLSYLADERGLALPYVPYMQLDNDALTGNQATGDCFSWSTRACIDITRVNENIHYQMGTEYIESSATCLIYGLRGHRNRGMTLYSVFNAVQQGGVLLEKLYDLGDEIFDFTSYDKYWEIGAYTWPRTGVPSNLLQETQSKRVEEMAICDSMEELDAALFSGRPVSCGSSINPGRIATKGVVSLQATPIAHAMAIIGVDKTREYFNTDIYVWDNSWGNYYTYNSHFPWFEKLNIRPPQGYFCLTRDNTWRAIRQAGSGVFSNVIGFPRLELPDLGYLGGLS